ncbi:MAG TPA: hypothetical protein VFM09_00790 [Marmoricola sp.]|nr:hypothetical protein [Marmoricola sp.]
MKRDVGALLRLLNRHPHVLRALRAAIAATAAWAVVQPLGGPADQYPYYAPFGAVVAVSTTVTASIRGSLQGLASLVLGVAIALAVLRAVPSEIAGLALVVGIGSLVAGWDRLGSMASWVPISAMFVLVIGGQHPQDYVSGYLGLTTLGAGIGIAVEFAFAPLPLSRTGAEMRRVRLTLGEQLRDLADGLRQDELLTRDEWRKRHHALIPITRQMSAMVAEASEARRGNWRAHRWVETARKQYERARALEQLTFLVEDITDLLALTESADSTHIALGPALRRPTGEVLDALADLLMDVEASLSEPDRLRQVDRALARLVSCIRERRDETGDDMFSAGSLVISVRRAVASLVPEDLTEELPSRH